MQVNFPVPLCIGIQRQIHPRQLPRQPLAGLIDDVAVFVFIQHLNIVVVSRLRILPKKLLREDAQTTYDHYVEMLNEDENGNVIDESREGLARELARMNLTLNTYTQWYWKVDLHNLLHFLSLRADTHAQYEIRVYADAMLASIASA